MIRLILLFLISFLVLLGEDKYLNLIKPNIIKIDNLNNNKSVIKSNNLEVGMSGIVMHIYENDKKIIVSNAKVISTLGENARVEYFPFSGLKQDSIANTKRKVSIGDTLILGYLYNKSIIIAPNVKVYNDIKKRFMYTSFIHPDIFAAKLKVENEKEPTQEDIQNFMISQDIGTIFFMVNKKIYIVDAKTFKILRSFNTNYENKDNVRMPFYTRIDKVAESIIDFGDKIYEEHYKKLLGLK